MAHLNRSSEKIKIITKKYDRFSFDKVLAEKTNYENQEAVLIELREFEQLGLLILKWMIYCLGCGTDLKLYEEKLEHKPIKCFSCRSFTTIDSEKNVNLMVYLTDKGKSFFRAKGRENLVEKE